MTDTPETQAPGKRPSLIAYTVRQNGQSDSYWDRIGVAWSHQDGQGFNVQLHAVPLDGRISLRPIQDKK